MPTCPYGLCGRKATSEEEEAHAHSDQELCESPGGRPGSPVPNSPYVLRGREATLEEDVYRERRGGGGGGAD